MCRLALACGRPDVAAFAAELDERDYQTWQAYYMDEPWDGRVHAAQLSQAIEVALVTILASNGKIHPGQFEPRPLTDHMVRVCQS